MSTDLVKQIDSVDLVTWSDDRRKEFSATFQGRLRASGYILVQTGHVALQSAFRRKFITERQMRKLLGNGDGHRPQHDEGNYQLWGGRSAEELQGIATARAHELLKDLPPLQNAIRVIMPETAKMIDQRDAILAKGQKLIDKLETLSEEKALVDYDQKMTVGDLVALLKKNATERKKLVMELEELGTEGCELENKIDKDLYSGVPGLADAVLKTVAAVFAKAAALDQVGRRVHEKVMFGDSKEAMDLLKGFENDEALVEDSARKDLKDAIAKLGITMRTKKGKKP